ncbi:MAG: AAA domain-containing protein, partial [Luteitalea sp.]|nr:AAA domain-containing protein [Luteitalea sp.]
LLRRIRELDPDLAFILMTAYSSTESAVEAITLGVYHHVKKPFNLDEMVVFVQRGLETTKLRREVKALRASQSAPYSFNHIMGESSAMVAAKTLLRKVAASGSSTVLITGESGTGKDLAAKAMHYASPRRLRPFMNITCSALTETLLESELFGHERGAFTDARTQKRGLLEQADGGTVFLDEIGETSPMFQVKLLRFLEEKTFKRVGGVADIRVDVRVVAATNRNLDHEVREGRFREDLFYRLSVLPLTMPSLRERREDIPPLAHYFVDQFNREFRKHVRAVAPDAMKSLQAEPWPGNVRQLRNAIERAMLLTDEDVLTSEFLMLAPGSSTRGRLVLPPEGLNIEEVERELVMQALERTHGNQTRAAALLGMHRDQIRYRIEKFGLMKVPPGTAAS